MNTTTIRTASGYALVLAALCCIVGGVLHPVVHGHAHSVEAILAPGEAIGTGALLAGTVLLLLGLPMVYAWRATGLGRLGFAGTLMYFVGNLLSAVPHLVVMALIGPAVARHAPQLISHDDAIIDSPAFATEQVISGFVLVFGLMLLGVALVRDRSLPRWIGVLAIAGTCLMVVPLPVTHIVTGLVIEVPRGVVIAAVGVLAVRSAKRTSSNDIAVCSPDEPALTTV